MKNEECAEGIPFPSQRLPFGKGTPLERERMKEKNKNLLETHATL